MLDSINKWFFNDIAFSESDTGYYESENDKKISLNKMLQYNDIARGLSKHIENFFGENELNVYKLVIEKNEMNLLGNNTFLK